MDEKVMREADDLIEKGMSGTRDEMASCLYAGRGEDILEMMEYSKGRIAHVHLKDQTAEDGRKYVTLGLGAVPNEKIVRAMAAARYDGWYTLGNPVGDTYDDTVRQTAF